MTALTNDLLEELNALRANDVATRATKNGAIEAVTLLRDTAESLLRAHQQSAPGALAVSVPFLRCVCS